MNTICTGMNTFYFVSLTTWPICLSQGNLGQFRKTIQYYKAWQQRKLTKFSNGTFKT